MAVPAKVFLFLASFYLCEGRGLYAVNTTISDRDSLPHHGRCEPITIPLCKDIAYNETIMPNILGHHKQEEAGLEVHQFFPLVKVRCSEHLQFFLCTIYAPVCTILDTAIPPCRFLCLSAKIGCEGLMNKFGFQWPESLDCKRFPEAGTDELCVGENATSSDSKPQKPIPNTNYGYPGLGQNPTVSVDNHNNRGSFVYNKPVFSDISDPSAYLREKMLTCPKQLEVSRDLNYSLRIGRRRISNCGAPCKNMFFSESEVNFSHYFIGGWSILCMASSLFTVLTFLLDRKRFKYPERPIIFLSACYFMIALVYIIGYLLGDSVACTTPYEPPRSQQLHNFQYLSTITQGTKKPDCTILFMMLYYFSVASSLWWVILCLTWFLSAGLKWGHEPIEAKSHYFHLAAWAVPATLTIAILAMGRVDGDVLSGVCSVGIWNTEAQRIFVIAPLIIFLLLGVAFLLAGFISLFRIRTIMKHDGTRTDKLEKLMIRIGVFSVLYAVPAIMILGCLIYEQLNLDKWMLAWLERACRDYRFPCPMSLARAAATLKYGGNAINDTIVEDLLTSITGVSPDPGAKPIFVVFMVKHLMYLIVGVTTGFWVASPKTFTIWKRHLTGWRSSGVSV
ncbi:frizzled-2-like [Artemia franciscana]|uniref:Uncharacterized protein n=1 Tax=Artemia franciscana TaxID=6661 RepID=A0AA88I4D6_ARTSF|nr:hypothetical protein QYM36_002944 [Artemia franciscana]